VNKHRKQKVVKTRSRQSHIVVKACASAILSLVFLWQQCRTAVQAAWSAGVSSIQCHALCAWAAATSSRMSWHKTDTGSVWRRRASARAHEGSTCRQTLGDSRDIGTVSHPCVYAGVLEAATASRTPCHTADSDTAACGFVCASWERRSTSRSWQAGRESSEIRLPPPCSADRQTVVGLVRSVPPCSGTPDVLSDRSPSSSSWNRHHTGSEEALPVVELKAMTTGHRRHRPQKFPDFLSFPVRPRRSCSGRQWTTSAGGRRPWTAKMCMVDEVGQRCHVCPTEQVCLPLAGARRRKAPEMMCLMGVWVTRLAQSRLVAEPLARMPSLLPPGSRSDDPATVFRRRNVEREDGRERKPPLPLPPPMTESPVISGCMERLERGQHGTSTDCRRSTLTRPAWRLASRADDADRCYWQVDRQPLFLSSLYVRGCSPEDRGLGWTEAARRLPLGPWWPAAVAATMDVVDPPPTPLTSR